MTGAVTGNRWIHSIAGAARQLLVLLVVAFALSLATYVLTASNTIFGTRSGAGAGTVSGYTVSEVHFTPNASDPHWLDAVAFTVDTAPPAGVTMQIKLWSAGSTYYPCTARGANVACATSSPPASVGAVDELMVIIGG